MAAWHCIRTQVSADPIVEVVLFVVFVFFVVELALTLASQPLSVLSSFFWLDVIATASVTLDVAWLSPLDGNSSEGQLSLVRASRAARVGPVRPYM